MFLTEMYKIEVDGIIKITGTLPKGVTPIEILNILNAEEGMDLVRIAGEENVGSNIWLRNGNVQENYKEVEHEEPEINN